MYVCYFPKRNLFGKVDLHCFGLTIVSNNTTSFEKITHMQRRWRAPQNFCLTSIDELEKQLLIEKTVGMEI